ncbi:uncharacterized protein LOC141683451 [Apium graveolens]|uniref:uncharacterized protein LOC141683451 n=1 Tax=Apium graveolens TaxID=4045 RepID=UPI003D78F17C
MDFDDIGDSLIALFHQDVHTADFKDFGESLLSLFYLNKYINDICMICLSSLETGRSILIPNCGHWLHTSCFVEYWQERCPTCRAVMFDFKEETVDWAPPTDDDDMGYEEVMEAARRVPRHLVVIGSDTDSDTDVVDPFDDFAYDFAQDA